MANAKVYQKNEWTNQWMNLEWIQVFAQQNVFLFILNA